MYHAVDIFVSEPDFVMNGCLRINRAMDRADGLNHAFDCGVFKPLGAVEIGEKADIRFHTDMISNPDNIMLTWNELSPNSPRCAKTRSP